MGGEEKEIRQNGFLYSQVKMCILCGIFPVNFHKNSEKSLCVGGSACSLRVIVYTKENIMNINQWEHQMCTYRSTCSGKGSD